MFSVPDNRAKLSVTAVEETMPPSRPVNRIPRVAPASFIAKYPANEMVATKTTNNQMS